MLNSYLHSPEECNKYALFQKPKFSHTYFFIVILRRFLYVSRVSTPFLSGDLFATLVDYAPWRSTRHRFLEALRALFLLPSKDYEPKINLRRLASANSIFIPSHKLSDFIHSYEKHINAKVIICGNSDFNFTEIPHLPISVKKCMFQNSAISDGIKILTLPIGLENLALRRAGEKRFHKRVEKHLIYDRILIPPMSPTNPERYKVLIWGRDNSSIADTFFTLMRPEQYFTLARNYKFIFCSEGNGFENHRVWESLYQGSFPVMLRTAWSASLAPLDLPILLIDSYTEIIPSLLVNHLEKNRDFDPAKCNWLWADAWKKLISESSMRES